MFVSMNWIRDFVNLDGEDLTKLIQKFTLSTAEVEGIEYKGSDISDVVVGEIISCEDHPDSDHLHVLKVDAGDEVFDVVCGAPNARAGIKTAFCKVGGMVSGHKLSPAKLRGVMSYGMCCSMQELGLSDNHDGIMELDLSYANGTDIKDIFPVEDIVFEVDNKSLTNRPDLWGHYGIAREFAALTGNELKALPILENSYSGDDEVAVEIGNKDLVFRYSSVRIENITKHVSPMEMQIRLYYCGTRAINLLADITNYIMLELGQPMHAFDGSKVSKIVVDTPKTDIKFTTLDGVQRDITTDTLLIYDCDTPVGIAGIMGGLDSEITDDTNSLVLESANFDAVSIRKSAARMALRTDASARYEKTLDPEMTMLAVKRFIKLLNNSDPDAKCVSKITDVYAKHYPERTVSFDKAFIDRYTGIDIPADRIEATLNSLGFGVDRNGDSFIVSVPSYRATKDVSMQADIVEEITRIYGYDNFAIGTTMMPLLPARTSLRRKNENYIKDMLVKRYAMHEVHTRVWCDPDELRAIGLAPEDNVRLLGASEEKDNGILRNTMFFNFLPLVYKNRSFASSFGMFEVGRVVKDINPDDTANERRMLAVCFYSKEDTEKSMYIKAVGFVNELVNELKHKAASYKKVSPKHVWQHPKNTSEIVIDGKVIGVINTIHPSTMEKISKNAHIICVEIDLDLFDTIETDALSFDEPSKFPTIEYDLSLLMPEGVRFEDIKSCWEKLNIKELVDVKVIDIYDVLPSKSITVRFVFGAEDRTLTSEEVSKDIDSILFGLNQLKVVLKG